MSTNQSAMALDNPNLSSESHVLHQDFFSLPDIRLLPFTSSGSISVFVIHADKVRFRRRIKAEEYKNGAFRTIGKKETTNQSELVSVDGVDGSGVAMRDSFPMRLKAVLVAVFPLD